MILSNQVRWIAKGCLDRKLKRAPGALKHLVESPEFETYVRRATERANQLDLEGFIRGPKSLTSFVEMSVVYWAKNKLKAIEHQITKQGNDPDPTPAA